MAHSGIFSTKIEIDLKVGERVDATGYTEANINNACLQAEAFICARYKYDFVTSYETLNIILKRMLGELSACWVAIDFISYNMEAYGSRIQAENLMNIHIFKIQTILEALDDEGTREFLKLGN